MINITEQWIQGGDCGKCRKASYCSKPCNQHSKLVNKKMSAVNKKMNTSISNTKIGKMMDGLNSVLKGGKY